MSSSHNTPSLRSLLRNLDGSAASIQKAAAGMMKHFAHAQVAVTEWRDALHSSSRSNSQLLPLLYVANETIQTSKRNRGSKFLEAFAPVLGQSLLWICERDPSLTPAVCRTVQVWGDRHVFSQRFVGELLRGLEVYKKRSSNQKRRGSGGSLRDPSFSQQQGGSSSARTEAEPPPPEETKDEDILEILQEDDNDGGDDGDDDDDDMFQDNSESQKLKIDLDLDAAVKTGSSTTVKRRRSSLNSSGSGGDNTNKRSRRTVLSASNLLEVWNRLIALGSTFDHSKVTLAKIDDAMKKTTRAELESSVGDSLEAHYRQIHTFQSNIAAQRETLHDTAQQSHGLENQARRYIPWLEQALKQDDQDLDMCDALELKLQSFMPVHAQCKEARERQRAQDLQTQLQEQAKARKLQEEEEERRFRQASLARETEAKPGMQWNPVTREYQNVNTNEDWRDH